MQQGLYVALSSQMALQKRLDTLAHNVANTSTAGFRAEEVRFETMISSVTEDPVAFAGVGDSYLARRSGSITKTGNPLDIAVKGEAWLAVQTPEGQVLTRDGRLQMTATGELQTANGFPVLDAGGAPIRLDPAGGPPVIGLNGAVRQGQRPVGTIGLFQVDADARLTRAEGSGVIPSRPPRPIVEFSKTGTVQGYVENSNVDPVLEMSRLIAVTRAFDIVANSINAIEDSQQDAIRMLTGA